MIQDGAPPADSPMRSSEGGDNPHTPGPWRVLDHSSQNKGFIAVVAGEKDHICDVFPFGARPGGMKRELEQHARNARLIAAAPDLLAALQNIVEEIRAYQSPECDDEGAPGAAELKAADAAIAKAIAPAPLPDDRTNPTKRSGLA